MQCGLLQSSEPLPATQLIPQARDSELVEILQRYPAAYRADPTRAVPIASGFSGARIWKLETPVGPFALRATSKAAIDISRLAGLHRLIAHVRDRGVDQVAVPECTLEGTTIVERGGFLWQLEPWMPGVADFSRNPHSERLAAAAVCLGRWHQAAADFEPQDSEVEWFYSTRSATAPGLVERLREIGRWNRAACDELKLRLDAACWQEFADLGRALLERFVKLAPQITSRIKLGLETGVRLQPCLRDIWHDHVLFSGDDVTGLIDPNAARSECVAADLARLLGSLVGDDRPAWDAGLASYQQVRPLTLNELALVELYDQSAVLLSGMTWLDWHCLQGREFERREVVLERLRALVARLEVLARK
jgi:Ser/Thr protein kinase RdoA (MazF antagonist)